MPSQCEAAGTGARRKGFVSMNAYLHCLSHTPLIGHFDPPKNVLDEVDEVVRAARARIAAFDPELVVLFAPDHYNGFFYDVMPPFCLGMAAEAIGDFGSLAGTLSVPKSIAEACAESLLSNGIDMPVSYHAGRPRLRSTARIPSWRFRQISGLADLRELRGPASAYLRASQIDG